MSFLQHFAELPDPRSHINRTYGLLDIVFLTVCAVLSGAEGWKDIEKFGHTKLAWLHKFRRFEAGIPVDDTIARIIRPLSAMGSLPVSIKREQTLGDGMGNLAGDLT